jgi:threonine dehydrogenase-like Zn-dependent dehydrogenase
LDHSLATPLDFRQPNWRRLTVVLGVVACLEALVILVAAVVLVVKPVAHRLEHAASAQSSIDSTKVGPRTPAGKATLDRGHLRVLVLNGNGVSGAAAAAASRLHRLGYRIGQVGNAGRSNYPKSIVMYKRGFRPEAMRLARDVRTTVVGPLDGIRVGALHGANLVYVIGA